MVTKHRTLNFNVTNLRSSGGGNSVLSTVC